MGLDFSKTDIEYLLSYVLSLIAGDAEKDISQMMKELEELRKQKEALRNRLQALRKEEDSLRSIPGKSYSRETPELNRQRKKISSAEDQLKKLEISEQDLFRRKHLANERLSASRKELSGMRKVQ
jgi:hypothetical protein